MVVDLIHRELDRERLPVNTYGVLDADAVRLAKTADRKVLGCMTDMAFLCEVMVEKAGGLDGVDVAAVNQRLRRNLMSLLGRRYPIDLAAERADGRS